MKNLYKPYILFFTVTIPQITLFSLFYKLYSIIGSELTPEAVKLWTVSAIVMPLCCIIFTAYASISIYRKKEIHPLIAVPMFSVYTTFLTIYFLNHSSFIPSNIPNWLFMGIEPGMSLLTLIMPALAYAMLIAVHWTVEKYKIKSVEKDIFMVFGIPFFWYTTFHLMFGIFRMGLVRALEKIIPIVFILSATVFFFFLVRVVYVLLSRKTLAWKNLLAPLVLIGSILGLLLNRSMGNVFGDFSHYGFYVLAAATSLLMIIPETSSPRLRLIIFIARSITYVYSIYFFLVFLPYLPLSLIAIIAFGAGILMLVPLILTLLHTKTLYNDFMFLKRHYKKGLLAVLFAVAVLSIPALLTASISDDRINVDNALKHTYQRSFTEKAPLSIDTKGVERVLNNIKYLKSSRNDFFNFRNTNTPYLSAFYNWYVLDNTSMADSKIRRLEQAFLGEYKSNNNQETFDSFISDVYIRQIDTSSIFDSAEGVYKSWISFELQNNNDFQGEFVTNFELPEGCYITDYYLYVPEGKKFGMIADKRAANWVYNQNKLIRRDPGIISNIGGNKYELKVFPFGARETRKTGMEISHRTPFALQIENRTLQLGETSADNTRLHKGIIQNKDYAYIPKEVKDNLKITLRKPAYYFVIDCSAENKQKVNQYIDRIKEYIDNNDISTSVSQIVLVNYNEKIMKPEEDWSKGVEKLGIKAGFNLDYTIKRILYESYTSNSEYYPVIIISTDNIDKAILSRDFESLGFTCPEGIYYYHLMDEKTIARYSLLQNSSYSVPEHIKQINYEPVAVWHSNNSKSFYLPNNQQDDIVLLNDNFDPDINEVKASKWEQGIMLKAAYMSYLLHPEKYTDKSVAIVRSSINSNTLSPLTSFIVLENEAQEKAMLQKQKELLATDKPVDVNDMTEMDEPAILLIAIPLMCVLLFVKKRRRAVRQITS